MTTPAIPTEPRPGDVWTKERVTAFGLRMPGVSAVAAVYGVSRTRAYELLQSGQKLAFPVLRVGKTYVVPTRAVLDALQALDDEEEMAVASWQQERGA